MSAPGRRASAFALPQEWGNTFVLFSIRDLELLRLLRWCRYARPDDISEAFDQTTISNLISLKLVRLQRSYQILTLTAKGNKVLDENFEDIPEYVPLSYKSADTLRKIRGAKLVLTAYRAGLSVFTTQITALERDASCFLPTLMRGRGANPWSNSRVAALLRLRDTVYAAHFIYPDAGGVLLTDELNTFSNNTSQIGRVNRAFFFAGENYQSVLKELDRGSAGKDDKLLNYGDACRKNTMPVYLLACDETGALQLRIMSAPDYRKRLTRAALRSKFAFAPPEVPCWDALFEGLPFVMAADMDLRRIDAALDAARVRGMEKIALAALRPQVKEVLNPRYKETGLARVFTLTDDAIKSLGDMNLYAPSPEGCHTPEGGVIDAPLIKAPGKAGGPAGKPVRKLDRAQ